MENIPDLQIAESSTSRDRPTIGLLLDWLTGGFQSGVWHSVAERCQQRDINLVCFVGRQIDRPDGFDFPCNVLFDLAGTEKNVDGIIILATIGSQRALEEMQAFCQQYQPLPVVTIAIQFPGIPAVLTNNYQSIQHVMAHLLDVHGYRRIGFYRKTEGIPDTDERYQAYLDTLAAYDIPVNPDLIVPGQYYSDVAGGVKLLFDERRLRPGHDLEALVAVDDNVVQGLFPLLEARGIRVPDDLAVTGFNDDEQAQLLSPPLTTARQPIYEQGRRAVDLLLAQLRGDPVSEQILLPGKLIVRQSCGCQESALLYQNLPGVQGQLQIHPVTDQATLTIKPEQRLTEIQHTIAFIANELLTAPVAPRVALLVEAFWRDVQRDVPEEFLLLLRESIRQGLLIRQNIPLWQEMLSLLYHYLLPLTTDSNSRERAHFLIDQARGLLGNIQSYHLLEQEKYFERVNLINSHLITTFDVRNLLYILEQHLPSLGIAGCYLSIYEDPTHPTTWANLLMAYHQQGRIFMNAEGVRFPTPRLAPEGMLPQDRRYHLVLQPLHVGREQIGFIAFEAGSVSGDLFHILGEQISSALKGALLIQQQRESEWKLRSIFKSAPIGIFYTVNQIIMDTNDYFCTLTGYARHELLTRNARIFHLTDEEFKRVGEEKRRQVTEYGAAHIESIIRRKDGTLRNVIFSSTLFDADVPQSGTIFTALDITDRKRAEEERQRAKEAAEAANRAKSQFLASISHELRTPLSAILGYTQVLQRDSQLNPERAAEELQIIRNSAEHLLSLINDLLDLERIEALKLELYPTTVSFPNFLAELVKIIRIRTEQKTLQLRYVPVTPLPALIMVDEKRLRQVLLNLLENAVKFTPTGTITLRVQSRESDNGYQPVATHRLEGHESLSVCVVRFEVEDTGIGIALEDQEKIFREFEQAGAANFRAAGAGLGLAISRKLVQMMGGDINVRSQIGQGSTFWFELSLPMVMTATETAPISWRQVVGYHGPTYKILVVDDHTTNRGVIMALLRPLGFDVYEAGSGAEAIQMMSTCQPDLILMDIFMPGLNGIETVQRIRQLNGHAAQAIIIAMSASVPQLEREHQASGLWNGFLSKPVDVEQLLRQLEHHLHLEWRYAEPVSSSGGAPELPSIPSDAFIPPSQEELGMLDAFVQRGDLYGIQQYAATLEARNPQLQAFARKIALLAKNYQDEAIQHLLTQFSSGTDRDAPTRPLA